MYEINCFVISQSEMWYLGNFFYLLHTSVESYDTRTVFFFWQIAALIYVYYLYFLTLFKILLFSLCEGLTWLT